MQTESRTHVHNTTLNNGRVQLNRIFWIDGGVCGCDDGLLADWRGFIMMRLYLLFLLLNMDSYPHSYCHL